LLLNYRHNRFAITPSLQFAAGQRYGEPENTEGIDPTTCATTLPGTLSSTDPRYMGGTAGLTGGSAFDATSCFGALRAIPDIYNNNHYDNIGQFVSPAQLLGNVLLTYDVSPKVSLQATFANVFDMCFGGTKTAWTSALGSNRSCSYIGTANAFVSNPVGNFYNPGTPINPAYQYPYVPYPGVYEPSTTVPFANGPFTVFLDARIKF
jgi:hypothetical protein